jgi:ribosomal protein S27AE
MSITENLPYHLYEIKEKITSQIDPDYSWTETVGFKCPLCKTKRAPLKEHGETSVCGKCGLSSTRDLIKQTVKCTTQGKTKP